MKCIDLAVATYKSELAEPSDVSIASIATYFRYNIGELNNILGACYSLNSTSLEIIDEHGIEISQEAGMIYKYLYLLSYYGRQVRNSLGVGGVSIALQVSSDQGVVRLVDKTNIAKLYIEMKKETEAKLTKLVNKWKFRNQNATQVEGADIFVSPQTYYGGYGNSSIYERDIL